MFLLIQSIILGLVQGLTEFIPVSSSAHLLLIPAFFGWKEHSLAFDTTLHLGTSMALIVFFFNDFKEIVYSFFSDLKTSFLTKSTKFGPETKLGFSLIIGSIPALVLGFLLNDYFENTFRDPYWTFYFIIIGALLMAIAEYFYLKRLPRKVENITDISFGKSLLVGIFQSLALFPGFSRSGSTISAGMLFGLSKESSARFSFLLSLPIILSAGLYQLISNPVSGLFTLNTLVGFIVSFVSGLFAIRFLIGYLKTNKLYPFVVYRFVLALLIILLLRP